MSVCFDRTAENLFSLYLDLHRPCFIIFHQDLQNISFNFSKRLSLLLYITIFTIFLINAGTIYNFLTFLNISLLILNQLVDRINEPNDKQPIFSHTQSPGECKKRIFLTETHLSFQFHRFWKTSETFIYFSNLMERDFLFVRQRSRYAGNLIFPSTADTLFSVARFSLTINSGLGCKQQTIFVRKVFKAFVRLAEVWDT